MSQQHNRKTGDADLDAYADVMIEMREKCEADGLNFRKVMAGLARTWTRGKEAPAMPSTPNPPPNTRKETDVRQSIVLKSPASAAVEINSAVSPPPPSPVAVDPSVSPAMKCAALLQAREAIDAELGRLLAGMGIPVMPAAAMTVAPAPEPTPPVATASEVIDEGEEPAPPRAKRKYVRRNGAAKAATRAAAGDAPATTTKRGAPCLVCVERPDRLLTHSQARDMAGIAQSVSLAGYIAKGMKAGGKYTFRNATPAELAAGRPAAPNPDDDQDDDVAGEASATPSAPRADGRQTYECLGCFTHVTMSREPGKCGRCGGKRFRVAPANAVGAA